MNEALRDWVATVEHTHYVVGSTAGPHPFPSLVRELQSVIGREAREQILSKTGRLPTVCVACVGGGSNAMGLFSAFLADDVRLIGIEAAGRGLDAGAHSAPLCAGVPGVLHGARTYLLQDEDGQVTPAHSVAAGLDYPGVGPELSHLLDEGRLEARAVVDDAAIAACRRLCRAEGILPALESSHALAALPEIASEVGPDAIVIVNLSGRGDKDAATLALRLAQDE
jgi:tryptophan synthase beta chain